MQARADDLLPRGAEAAPAAPAPRPERADKAAALLPPGAATAAPSAAAGEAELAIPSAPVRLPAGPVNQPADAGLVAVKETPKVIGSGDDEVEVRRLSPEEKSRRRFRKSLILWTICLLVLIAVFYFFTR